MLTLKSHPENILVAEIRQGKNKKLTPVFWHPTVKPELRNAVENLDYFFGNEDFRTRFELSQDQAQNIKEHMSRDQICQELHSKHFKCKRFISDALNQEMDISDQPNMKFEVNFPKGNNTWGCLELAVGASSSGKTFHCVEKVRRNLDGPKADRRKFLWFSAEWKIDKTVAPLRDLDRYREDVIGIDCSDGEVEDSQYDSALAFYQNEIASRVEHASPGTICVFDDPKDFAEGVAPLVRRLIDKMQRVSRHKSIGLIFILHSLKSGAWSSQANNSCRYFTVFPRSQQAKIRRYLNEEIGMTLKESRRAVADFKQHSRALTIRLHSPQCLISDKMIRLL